MLKLISQILQARKYDGKAGKGLSHFQRIEVPLDFNQRADN